MFSFAADSINNKEPSNISEFFENVRITKYHIARIDDSSNMNPVENIILNGQSDRFEYFSPSLENGIPINKKARKKAKK